MKEKKKKAKIYCYICHKCLTGVDAAEWVYIDGPYKELRQRVPACKSHPGVIDNPESS